MQFIIIIIIVMLVMKLKVYIFKCGFLESSSVQIRQEPRLNAEDEVIVTVCI